MNFPSFLPHGQKHIIDHKHPNVALIKIQKICISTMHTINGRVIITIQIFKNIKQLLSFSLMYPNKFDFE